MVLLFYNKAGGVFTQEVGLKLTTCNYSEAENRGIEPHTNERATRLAGGPNHQISLFSFAEE